ncbi:MAG: tetratricopeptide repeat protein [Nitrospinae bacterium]|nr:tetratricopeptide repeat protein [Nitrospinota bacterium]
MPTRGVVFWTGLLLMCSTVWIAPQRSVTWAQAPTEATVYVDRGVLAYDAKRFDEALKEVQEALRLDPQNVEALYYQGLVYVALNRTAEAQAAWEKAIALRPADVDVAFQLGTLYFSQEQYDKAEPLLRQVYRAEPRRQNLGYYLGFIDYRAKNYRAAVDLLRANVPSDENFAQLARFYAGLAMSALGFPREARAQIEEALRLQPLSPLTTPTQRFGEALERAAERERFFRGELRVGLFYDTNVPVVPNASIDLVAQVLRQKTHKSEGELGSLNLGYTWLKTLDWEGTVAYRFLQTYNNHLPNFNTQSHTPNLGIAYRSALLDMPYFAGLQSTYDFITLGDKKFTQRWIANPYFTLAESPGNLTTLQLRFQVKDFFNDRNVVKEELRDGVNYMLGPLHFFLFEEGRHYLKVGYQYDFDAADGANWEYGGHRFLFGTQYTLPWWDVRLRYDLDFHLRYHTHKHSLLPVPPPDQPNASGPGTTRRRDREAVHLFSIAKDFAYKSQNFTVALEYLFDSNGSNLAAFDYDRHVITSSLAWRF